MQVIKRGDGFWLKVTKDENPIYKTNDENGPFRSVKEALETYQECYDMTDVDLETLAIFAGRKLDEVM